MIIRITARDGSTYHQYLEKVLRQFCQDRGIRADIITVDDNSDDQPAVIIDGFRLPCQPHYRSRSINEAVPLRAEIRDLLERRAWLG